MKKIIVIMCASLILSGCISYKAVGKFDNNSEMFIGNVNHNLMGGGGKFEFTGVNSNVNCNGIAGKPDKIPLNFDCSGQEGNADGTCSDGKTLRMRWYALSCTTGYGNGSTSDGTRFQFTFGLTKEEAMTALNKMLDEAEASNKINNNYQIKKAETICNGLGVKTGSSDFKKCVLEHSN